MTLVLDSGGLSALAGDRGKLHELRRRGMWPALVPTVVLTESLTGDHRRDFGVNRLVRACQVCPVDELLAREAARLRTATGRAGMISVVDALVAALASASADGTDSVVLTSDPGDLTLLAEHAVLPFRVVGL